MKGDINIYNYLPCQNAKKSIKKINIFKIDIKGISV